jgi:hypothetical protein
LFSSQAKFSSTYIVDLFGVNQPNGAAKRPGHSQGKDHHHFSAMGSMAPGGGSYFTPKSMDAMFDALAGGDTNGALTLDSLKVWLADQHQRIKGSTTQAVNNNTMSLFDWDNFEVDEVRAFFNGGRPPPPEVSDDEEEEEDDDDENVIDESGSLSVKTLSDESAPELEKQKTKLKDLELSRPELQRLLRLYPALGFEWEDGSASTSSGGLGGKGRGGGAVTRDSALQIFRRMDTDGDGWVHHTCRQ